MDSKNKTPQNPDQLIKNRRNNTIFLVNFEKKKFNIFA